jgi:hypothetical protein
MVSTLAMTDALAKLLIEKGLITDDEFKKKLGEESATYGGRFSIDLVVDNVSTPARCFALVKLLEQSFRELLWRTTTNNDQRRLTILCIKQRTGQSE